MNSIFLAACNTDDILQLRSSSLVSRTGVHPTKYNRMKREHDSEKVERIQIKLPWYFYFVSQYHIVYVPFVLIPILQLLFLCSLFCITFEPI